MRCVFSWSVIVLLCWVALPVWSQPVEITDEPSLAELTKQFERAKVAYLKQLQAYLPDAYRERFASLSDEQLAQMTTALRHWEFYIAHGPTPIGDHRRQVAGRFRDQFLKPMDEVAEMLLIDPQTITEPEIAKVRAEVVALGKRLMAARKAAKFNIDPTVGKRSPTGIPLPNLDQPHTCLDALDLYERTLVLAYTVAPSEARPLLMETAKLCLEVDVEEANFVMYGNKVRMLSGTVVWTLDPLMAAVARDHSIDRKAGRAKSHESSVPGKRWPADRAKRMGAPGGSEGAGGSKTGVGQMYGYSYNGVGHGLPLYGTRMNVTGPGIHQGMYTSMYRKDPKLLHACQASRGELFMPPGITARDLKSSPLRSAYQSIKKGRFGAAYKTLHEKEPGEGLQGAIHRYFLARIDAEVTWAKNGVKRIFEVGDVYAASERLSTALKMLKGVPAFEDASAELKALFDDPMVQAEIKAGKIFYKIGRQQRTAENFKAFIERYPDSVYTQASKACLELGLSKMNMGYEYLYFFSLRDPALNEWGYLYKVSQ